MTQEQKRTEHDEQAIVVNWLALRRIGCFAVPNGAIIGGRNKFGLLTKLRKEGMRPGAPDLILTRLSPSGKPVAIEMKAPKGKLSVDQCGMRDEFTREGWVYLVANGADDAIKTLTDIYFK